MKSLLRYYLINFVALWITTEIIPGLSYTGGISILARGALIFMVINFLLIPLIKLLLLPLNLLTLGFFAWTTNALALYVLTMLMPKFKLLPYQFPGFEYQGFIIPSVELSVLWVAIIASLIIGIITHFLHWLIH